MPIELRKWILYKSMTSDNRIIHIHSACTENSASELAHLLEYKIFDVNCRSIFSIGRSLGSRGFGMTPLMTAAAHNTDPDVISLLIRNGARIHDRDNDGTSALFHAIISNPKPNPILRSLIQNGAQSNETHPMFGNAYKALERRYQDEDIWKTIDRDVLEKIYDATH